MEKNLKKPKFKKPVFNKKRIERLIKKLFKNAEIISYEKLENGLVHSTFKVNISNPSKKIIVRLSKKKNLDKITKNNKVLNYLHDNNIPAPKIYLQQIYHNQLITIMEFLKGLDAEKFYIKSNQNKKAMILKDAGKTLKRIHNLKIPEFWKHQKHEIKNKRDWVKWTKERIEKYLIFAKKFLPEYYDYLKEELHKFQKTLISEKEKIIFSPLHWDYHLANMNINSKGKITGVFDFDNCMKGHNLADIGQTKYWIWFRMKNPENFRYFLEGYKKRFTKKEIQLINGYFLLHMLAVTRTIWKKQPRLTWIIKEHKKILDQLNDKE